MRIKCGNCTHHHDSVDAVRACYGDDSRMLSDATSGATSRDDLRDRAEARKATATGYGKRMATPKMERYVGNLAAEREMTPETSSAALTMIKAGTLNFDYARQFIDQYKNAPRRTDRKQTVPSRIDKDGMYRDPHTGEIYKIQWNKAQGDGRRLYAKRLVVSAVPKGETDGVRRNVTPGIPIMPGTAEVSFVYAGGLGRVLIRPEWKLTADDARKFGALYGNCVRCGRDLTLESSVAMGYGETCAAREGWPYDPKAVPA